MVRFTHPQMFFLFIPFFIVIIWYIFYGSKYDNANVNIAQAEHGKLIAMTETPNVVVFDISQLLSFLRFQTYNIFLFG